MLSKCIKLRNLTTIFADLFVSSDLVKKTKWNWISYETVCDQYMYIKNENYKIHLYALEKTVIMIVEILKKRAKDKFLEVVNKYFYLNKYGIK